MTIYDSMIEAYHPQTPAQLLNARHEVMQQIVLAGLDRGGFFDYAAFYGGTCLRIFHNLQRFSEDMDFSLLEQRDDIHIEQFFPAIVEEFKIIGKDVEIKKKDKKTFGKVESAFLKETTEAYDVAFRTEKSVKIKIELDTCPPLRFATEQKVLHQPYSFMTRCFCLSDLFAGKMHALVYRNWKTRIKGRDWYDFEWYVTNGTPLDFIHLQERIRQFNGEDVTQEQFIQLLRERLSSANIEQVKQDVLPFVRDPRTLGIWSNKYFLMLADKIRFL